MKKHIVLFFAFSLFFCTATFGQRDCPGCSSIKDQWIWVVINDPVTKEFWFKENINPNPNVSVDYGDSIPIYFDGEVVWTEPADSTGESPWSLIGDYYAANVAPVIAETKSDSTATLTPVQNSMWSSENLPETIKWLFLFFALLAILYAISNRKWLFNTDNTLITEPVATKDKETDDGIVTLTGENAAETAPVYANGLTDDTIAAHVVNQMHREGKVLPILGIKTGTLYSIEPVNVAFNDRNRPSLLRGVPGYEVTLDLGEGKTTKRYTLKPCGNDVTPPEETGIENVIFVPDSTQPEILQPIVITDEVEDKVADQSNIETATAQSLLVRELVEKIISEQKNVTMHIEVTKKVTTYDISYHEPNRPRIFVGGLYSAQDLFGG